MLKNMLKKRKNTMLKNVINKNEKVDHTVEKPNPDTAEVCESDFKKIEFKKRLKTGVITCTLELGKTLDMISLFELTQSFGGIARDFCLDVEESPEFLSTMGDSSSSQSE